VARPQLAPLLDSNKNNCAWYGNHLVSEALEDWCLTKGYRDEQRIVIQEAEDWSNVKWFKPLHRHHKRYRIKQSIRISKIRDFSMPVRYFVTLTIDPKKVSNDFQAYKLLTDTWRKIYYRLKRKFPRLQALRCVEPQKTGNPHMHLLLFGCHIPQYLKWARSMYQFAGGYIKIEPARAGNKGAASYVGKYLTKGLKNDFCLAFLTRWKSQTLTVSGSLLRKFLGPLLEKKGKSKWVFVDYTTDYGDCCVKLGEDLAELIYYPQEKGPPVPDWSFIRP